MEGLKSLLTHLHVEQMRKKENFTFSEWDDVLAFAT